VRDRPVGEIGREVRRPDPIVGRVLAVNGKSVVMTIVGMGGAAPEGVEFLSPNDKRRGRIARVSSGTLLRHWDRMSGDLGRLIDMPVRDAAC